MRVVLIVGSLFFAIGIDGCSNKSSPSSPVAPEQPGSLLVSPDTLTVSNASPAATVLVSTSASVGEHWHVMAKPGWTTVTPDSGIATQSGQTISVTADTVGLAYGEHWGDVSIASASDTAMLVVRLAYAAPPPFHFHESFDGPLDATVWWTEDLASGQRWCDSNAGSSSGPGQWVDPSVELCYGAMQAVPYGSAVLSAGTLQLSSEGAMRTFPLLTSRYPGTVAVFPAAGDFRCTVRVRYDSRTAWGTGVVVLSRDSTEPMGTHYPSSASDVVFGIWADPSIRASSAVSGTTQVFPVTVTPTDDYHDYSFADSAGTYVFSIDGAQVYGPVASTMRPTAIQIGNPVFSYWSTASWTGFTIDDITVDEIVASP